MTPAISNDEVEIKAEFVVPGDVLANGHVVTKALVPYTGYVKLYAGDEPVIVKRGTMIKLRSVVTD